MYTEEESYYFLFTDSRFDPFVFSLMQSFLFLCARGAGGGDGLLISRTDAAPEWMLGEANTLALNLQDLPRAHEKTIQPTSKKINTINTAVNTPVLVGISDGNLL